jgi:hypothetical protein
MEPVEPLCELVPGVVLVPVWEDDVELVEDCEDWEPQVELGEAEEPLLCGLLLDVESGVDVLPDCELLPEALGAFDWSCAMKLLCGGVVLSGAPLGGLGVLGAFGEGVVDAPALPEMLPAVFCPVGVLPPAFDAETVRSLSFTFLTPGTAFAMRFASFLSSLLFTAPVRVTLPFSTAT